MQTDVLLDLLLQEAKKSNDSLSIIKQNMIQVAKNTGNSSGGGNPPNPNPNPPPVPPGSQNSIKSVLDVFSSGLSSLSPLVGNSATASTAIKALGSGASSILGPLKAIPGPVGAAAQVFDMVVKAGVALYEYLDSQLKMYQELNSAGVQLSDGIFGFRKSAGDALLSMEQLSKVATTNSDTFAAMDEQYGDGIKHFGELVNTITLAQKQTGVYGLSQQQIADITAKNYKLQKLYATEAKFRDMNEAQTSGNYINSLVQMSKVLGVSIDQIMKKNEEFAKSGTAFNITNYLKNLLPDDTAEEVTKTFGELTSSLGEGGKVIQDVMSEFTVTGKLPADIGEYGNALIPYFDKMKIMMESGVSDPAQYQDLLKKITDDSSTMRQIALDMDTAQKRGNKAGMQFLSSIINMSKFMNDQAKNVPDAFETLQTRLENWIGESITKPINRFIGETGNNISQYLLDTYNSTESIMDTLVRAFGDGVGNLFGFMASLPGRLITSLFGYDFDSAGADAVGDMVGSITKFLGFVGKLIWDTLFGSVDDFKNDIQGIRDSVSEFIQSIFNWVDSLKNMFSLDNIKSVFSDLGDNVMGKFTAFFEDEKPNTNKPKKENNPTPNKQKTTTQSPKPSQPPIKSKPEKSTPPKIEKQDEKEKQNGNPNMPQEPTQAEIDIMNILNKLTSGSAETVAALNNAVKVLQNISTNTEPVRNA